MYNIIPLLLILISLSVVIVIVSRKFSVLASLDVDSIPAEKEAKFKKRIISNRLERNIIKYWARAGRLLAPLGKLAGDYLKAKLHKLYQAKNVYEASQGADDSKMIDQLFSQAEELKKHDDLASAERKYIEIIGLDSKNLKAFKELGRIYFEKKEFEEARETFEHILKLKTDDEDIYDNLAQIAKEKGDLNKARSEYLKSLNINKQNTQTLFSLAEVYRAMGKLPEAARSLKKVLKIESANPRYLDTMLEISIIIKDKALALDAYKKLAKANPDNNKLEEFKRQIDEM
ncbi:MAG: tetratricopeptide repeat protein [Parcubacteria group bacterium]|nr:tetratricopeptide repeat protein [Parcubacteria group bacterium]